MRAHLGLKAMSFMSEKAPVVRNLFGNFWRLSKPFWASEEKWLAIALLVFVISLNLGIVYMSVLFNDWNRVFYDALQKLDQVTFWREIKHFAWLAIPWVGIQICALYFRQLLEIKWRRWSTAFYTQRWMNHQNFYRIQLTDDSADNPDQRIAEDVDQFVSLSLGLFLGLLRNVVNLVTFVVILWSLSAPMRFMLAGNDITIHGNLVWAAVIYAMVGTIITILIGRSLVGLNFIQQRREADFRFSLVRIRENAESIAMYKGEQLEGRNLNALFANVVANFKIIMGVNVRVVGFTFSWSQFAVVFPLMIVAPRFFSGQILFGSLMQIRSAFSEVLDSLSFIMDSFRTMATWKAVIDRLTTFEASLDAAQALPRLTPQEISRGLSLDNLSVSKPNGEVLLGQLNLQLQAGDTLLVRGASGSGKSTLLRALAGIWPYASGKLGLQANTQILYLSQKPYMPLGTLRSALYYPQPAQHDGAKIAELLAMAGLSHLLPRLDETDAWSHVLSLGEQQRIALLRVLLLKPDFLFMDESTSALDVAGEARLYAAVVECMKNGVLVSVGHRVGLTEYHRQVLECQGQGAWSLAALN